jgi:hypothetical protein
MPLADARCAPDGYAEELQAIEDYRRFAVLTIQRFWRGHAVRQRQRRQVCQLLLSLLVEVLLALLPFGPVCV